MYDSLLLVFLLLILLGLFQFPLFGETFLSFDLTQELILLLGSNLITDEEVSETSHGNRSRVETDLFAVSGQNSLFKHSSGEDLEHSTTFFHTFLLSEKFLVVLIRDVLLFFAVPISVRVQISLVRKRRERGF